MLCSESEESTPMDENQLSTFFASLLSSHSVTQQNFALIGNMAAMQPIIIEDIGLYRFVLVEGEH